MLGLVAWLPGAVWAARGFQVGVIVGAFLGCLLGQQIAWWFLFPHYRRQWQQPRPKRRDRRGRWI